MSCSLVVSHSSSNELPLPISMAVTSKSQQNPVSFPFKFSCDLSKHPLLQISRLVELVRFISSRTPDKATCVAMGKVADDCNRSGRVHPECFTETVAHTEEAKLLILIKDAQQDPEYQVFLEEVLDEIEKLTGQSLRRRWVDAYIFIGPSTALKRHPSRESNFIFRIHEKEILFRRNYHSIFISLVALPGEDRTVSLNVFVPEPVISNSGESKDCARRTERSRSPQPGAKLGRDPEGTPAWYAPDPERPGKYLRVGILHAV